MTWLRLTLCALLSSLATFFVLRHIEYCPPGHLCYGRDAGNTLPPFSEHGGHYDDVSRTSTVYEITEALGIGLSKLQDLAVLKTQFFGKMMIIDGEIMVTERDERNYHEMIGKTPPRPPPPPLLLAPPLHN